jgi:hypothetical protein
MDAIRPLTPKVKPLQTEFAKWLRRYLPLPADVRALATAWFGVMQKCCNYVDALMSACCETLLPVTGDDGVAVVQRIAAGKPLDRLTLGEQTQILEAIDKVVSRELRRRLPNVVGQSRVLGRPGITMLHELSRMRNDFAHRRWQNQDGDRLASEFLTTASKFCNSQLLVVAIALEEGQSEPLPDP